MNTAVRPLIKPILQLYPLPGSKADRKYSILTPDPHHTAICQPFMGSAARSLGSHLPSYLGDINAAHRAIASAWRSPVEFTAAYNDARDRLVEGIDFGPLKNYSNQGPIEIDYPEIYHLLYERWDAIKADLFAEIDHESVGLAGRYYFFLKAAFGQVIRLNPKGTKINNSWHIDKLRGAIKFNPSDWCLQMALTPFDATIYDCWEKAIEAPPRPAETMLILDPPYGVDTSVSKITACYLGHQISANGQNDTLLDLAIDPLKRAIELGYQTIYLCNYRSPKLEEAIDQITAGYTVTRHDFGECRSLGNSAGRLSHGNRKDGRKRGSEAIWAIVSVGSPLNLPKKPESVAVSGSATEFGRFAAEPTEKQPLELAQQLIAALSRDVALLKAEGIAAPTQYLNEESKGDRNFYRLRWLVKGRVKSKSLKPSEVAEVRSRISRRNQVQALDQRIAEAHELVAKLEVIYANLNHSPKPPALALRTTT